MVNPLPFFSLFFLSIFVCQRMSLSAQKVRIYIEKLCGKTASPNRVEVTRKGANWAVYPIGQDSSTMAPDWVATCLRSGSAIGAFICYYT